MAKVLINMDAKTYEILREHTPYTNAQRIDTLTNGEVIQKIFKVSDTSEGMATMFAYTRDDDMLTADMGWWNRKWGE